MNNEIKQNINFGPDKSQILRGIAIIFMLFLHNGCGILLKICVPIFTFLVGYGYSFAKTKDLKHAYKRSWHLLSHFWLILLGIFLPVGIWTGEYSPTISNVLENMFGLESNLNWYSWYIYFYLYAMLIMLPVSRLITQYKIPGLSIFIIFCYAVVFGIHKIPDWSSNIWLQAIHDCFLCSPVMFVGYYLAETKIIIKTKIRNNWVTGLLALIIIVAMFFVRGLPFVEFLDFITVPIFCVAVVILFNIIIWQKLHSLLIRLGKESMNMWFFHALFATTCTAVVFAPLMSWIEPKILMIIMMIIVSYYLSKATTILYDKL